MEIKELEILFEDNHLLAVNKKNKEIVQQDVTGDISLEVIIKEYIKKKYHKKGEVFLGVIHRIDRPVSGVVLFARTSKSLLRMNNLFREKEVKKIYWAIVKNKPPAESGTLQHFIFRDTKKNKSIAFDNEVPDSKPASLSYLVIGKSDNYFFLEINLYTGRHHQIRCQLAKIGCPIKGDLKYGFARSDKNGGISLHSRSITFLHPVKNETITILAKPPEDVLWDYFIKLKM